MAVHHRILYNDPGRPLSSNGGLGHTFLLSTHYLVPSSALPGLGQSTDKRIIVQPRSLEPSAASAPRGRAFSQVTRVLATELCCYSCPHICGVDMAWEVSASHTSTLSSVHLVRGSYRSISDPAQQHEQNAHLLLFPAVSPEPQ